MRPAHPRVREIIGAGEKRKWNRMTQPRVSYLSLGCPKALVDSEHIVTELVERGYDVVAADDDAAVVVINTCGFIDAAKDESFDAIEQALGQGREVVVTGCLGADSEALLAKYPGLKHVSGPQDVMPVINAVQTYIPQQDLPGDEEEATHLPGEARARGQGTRLTPAHYAYLKISEGCNHTCSFCIIPTMRGRLVSRNIGDVLREAEGLAEQGVREVMVIAQDLSAYGADIKYANGSYGGVELPSRLEPLCRQLGQMLPWVRLHYVYPCPNVDGLIPLMADGLLLPYLDIPLQHAAPRILKLMRRPAAAERTLERIHRWREMCPELCIRSTFIVGFPGETDEDVGVLLDFLEAAKLDRVGCFTYSPVEGAAANALAEPVSEGEKLDRQERVYEVQGEISRVRLDRFTGQRLRVLIDEVDSAGAIARSMFDAPDIDGVVHVDSDPALRAGDFAWVRVKSHDHHDLYASYTGSGLNL